MNDLTSLQFPLTQDKFDKMFVSASNTIKDGLWAWNNMPPTLLGKATNLVRKLRDSYLSVLKEYEILITPTLPYLAAKLPAADATLEELMINSAGVSLNTSAFNLVSFVDLYLLMLGSTLTVEA